MKEWRKTPALKLRQRLGVEAPVTRGGLLHSPVSASRLGRRTSRARARAEGGRLGRWSAAEGGRVHVRPGTAVEAGKGLECRLGIGDFSVGEA